MAIEVGGVEKGVCLGGVYLESAKVSVCQGCALKWSVLEGSCLVCVLSE